jgi:peptidoglycan/xylan/chitin deacetylase (PgdA/CDA1 family)
VAATLFSAGCGHSAQKPATDPVDTIAEGAGQPSRWLEPPADPAAVHANELGVVPVLLYHAIVAHPRSSYDRTPGQFRDDLERLACAGFVPITARDYATGHIDIPAGKHPVVLTFDGGDRSQFAIGAPDPRNRGAISGAAPGTALAILKEVANRYPDFAPVATFYVGVNPFGDRGGQQTLPWLTDSGFEVGNYTATGADLRHLTDADVQRELAEEHRVITSATVSFTPVTMAYPSGNRPHSSELALRGASGGTSYAYRGAFLSGGGLAPSPYTTAFDALAIPRTDATVVASLVADPAALYTSDGNPATVAFPKNRKGQLAPAAEKLAVTY